MYRFCPILLILSVVLCTAGIPGCGDDDDGPRPAHEGKITAVASHIPDRQDDQVMIAVYDASVDWSPGTSNDLIISATHAAIDSDDYSLTHVMQEIDAQGTETGVEKSFAPETYSVLFFVAPPGQPPARFAEVRASVDGDVTVAAPAWEAWSGTGQAR